MFYVIVYNLYWKDCGGYRIISCHVDDLADYIDILLDDGDIDFFHVERFQHEYQALLRRIELDNFHSKFYLLFRPKIINGGEMLERPIKYTRFNA